MQSALDILVTGGDGFVGRHLVKLLLERGHRVTRTVRRGKNRRHRPLVPDLGPPALPGLEDRLVGSDDPAELARECLGERVPDRLVHLGASSSPPEVARDPAMATRVNVDWTRELLRELERRDPAGRAGFLLASTGAVYDPAARPPGVPLDESTPVLPSSDYVKTKLAAEEVVREATEPSGGRPAWILRPFHHAGPGQDDRFVISSWALQVAGIERGGRPAVLRTGNLQIARDFSDVRDVARAYCQVIERPVTSGTYNLAYGEARELEGIIEQLRRECRVPFDVEVDRARLRGKEPPSIVGDASRLRGEAGWKPELPPEVTVKDTLEAWRGYLAAQG